MDINYLYASKRQLLMLVIITNSAMLNLWLNIDSNLMQPTNCSLSHGKIINLVQNE